MDSSSGETEAKNESITEKTLEETIEEIKHPKTSKTSPNKIRLKNMLVGFVKRASLLLLGYIVCYFNLSLILPIIAICTIVYYESVKSKTAKRIQTKVWASNSMTKKDLLEIAKELPSWVTFPDKEKAEWINEIIAQMWPTLNCFIIKYCRGKIQNNIRKKFDSFRFEDMDFGDNPPKIDGVKVYNKFVSKEAIIIDFQVFYDGDCNINFSLSGTQVGRIKDFQMGVELRIVLKPILLKAPVVGGIQLFFLNVPDISFELDGISGIPGFSYIVRQKIEEIINKKLVFPNKITKRFTKTIEAAELRAIEPEGVLRVHVFEAKDLEKKDVTGKSDPYVILNVGAQEYKTHVIKRELNPQWDCYCEFIILDPMAQQLYFKLYDQDEFSEDDFLGSGAVDIYNAIKENNHDQWIDLDGAKHGKIHFRFSWLGLSTNRNELESALEETRLLKNENVHTALLVIYVESASNLKKVKPHKNPDPYIVLTVGHNQTKSRVKKHTTNPEWQQGFYLLVKNPENDSLIINVIDKQSDTNMDRVVYNIRELFEKTNLQISKEEIECQNVPGSSLVLSLQLRVLHNALFEDSDIDSDPDEFTEKTLEKSTTRNSTKFRRVSYNDKVNHNEEKEIFQAVEERVQKSSSKQDLSGPNIRTSNFLMKPEHLGRIELSLSYSAVRQKLTVIIHRAGNLVMKHPSSIPDPYVKIKLCDSENAKYKTKVVVDSCDPIYEEKFEFLVSESLLLSKQLVVTVKDKKMFTSRILGQAIIQLSQLSNFEKPLRDWFDLCEDEVSD